MREGDVILALGNVDITDGKQFANVATELEKAGKSVSALVRRGYSVNPAYAQRPSADEDVALYLLQGGQHNQASWAKMLPLFLQWAYPETSSRP